jgi:hypothetical protein
MLIAQQQQPPMAIAPPPPTPQMGQAMMPLPGAVDPTTATPEAKEHLATGWRGILQSIRDNPQLLSFIGGAGLAMTNPETQNAHDILAGGFRSTVGYGKEIQAMEDRDRAQAIEDKKLNLQERSVEADIKQGEAQTEYNLGRLDIEKEKAAREKEAELRKLTPGTAEYQKVMLELGAIQADISQSQASAEASRANAEQSRADVGLNPLRQEALRADIGRTQADTERLKRQGEIESRGIDPNVTKFVDDQIPLPAAPKRDDYYDDESYKADVETYRRDAEAARDARRMLTNQMQEKSNRPGFYETISQDKIERAAQNAIKNPAKEADAANLIRWKYGPEAYDAYKTRLEELRKKPAPAASK